MTRKRSRTSERGYWLRLVSGQKMIFSSIAALMISIISIKAAEAASILDAVNNMLNSGNLFGTIIGRISLTAMLCTPLIVVNLSIAKRETRNIINILGIVTAFLVSSDLSAIGAKAVNWIGWCISALLAVAAISKKPSEEYHYGESKADPLMIGFMFGVVSFIAAPFNSIIAGTQFTFQKGAINLITSPIVWLFLGVLLVVAKPLFGILGGMAKKNRAGQEQRAESKIEEVAAQANNEIIQDVKDINGYYPSIAAEERLADRIDADYNSIGDEFAKGDEADFSKVEKAVDDAEQSIDTLGKAKEPEAVETSFTQNVQDFPKIIKEFSDYNLALLKAHASIAKDPEKFAKRSRLGQAEKKLLGYYKDIFVEKKTGVWMEFSQIQEDKYREIIDLLKETKIPLLVKWSNDLSKKRERLNITKFLGMLRDWTKEIQAYRGDISRVITKEGRIILDSSKIASARIKELQSQLDELKATNERMAKYKKNVQSYLAQLKTYSDVIKDTKVPLTQRENTLKALKQRVEYLKKVSSSKNIDVKDIENQLVKIRYLISMLHKIVTDVAPSRKMLDSLAAQLGIEEKEQEDMIEENLPEKRRNMEERATG